MIRSILTACGILYGILLVRISSQRDLAEWKYAIHSQPFNREVFDYNIQNKTRFVEINGNGIPSLLAHQRGLDVTYVTNRLELVVYVTTTLFKNDSTGIPSIRFIIDPELESYRLPNNETWILDQSDIG